MTPPLLTQRSRDELIADLYDRHAAGLFAYCRDQLGDPETAGATVLAVLTAVSSVEPPRAALYALARREFARRDVVYSPPLSGTSPGPTRSPRSSSGSCATCARTSARCCTCPACARWTSSRCPGCSTWPPTPPTS
nr:hypothetical protein GCM10020093_057600 [Planobispora longispora]